MPPQPTPTPAAVGRARAVRRDGAPLPRQSQPEDLTKPVRWEAPEGNPAQPIVQLDGVDGLVLKGFIFDGGGKREKLVQLQYACPGVTLEQIELRGFTQAGVMIVSCVGEK